MTPVLTVLPVGRSPGDYICGHQSSKQERFSESATEHPPLSTQFLFGVPLDHHLSRLSEYSLFIFSVHVDSVREANAD